MLPFVTFWIQFSTFVVPSVTLGVIFNFSGTLQRRVGWAQPKKTTNQPRSADFFLRQNLREKQRIHSFFDHPMGQKGPSAYILHPSASILYHLDSIFVVLKFILEHFGRPLALLGILWCPYVLLGFIIVAFIGFLPFWYPYGTPMIQLFAYFSAF